MIRELLESAKGALGAERELGLEGTLEGLIGNRIIMKYILGMRKMI